MPLSNQPEPNKPIPRDDLRNTLLIIEKGRQYKDTDILEAILNVAFYMPSSNHMLYEYLQIYQGGIYERLVSNDRHQYLYADHDMAQAKEELYRRAYGDFKEALWLLEQDLRAITTHSPSSHYSDVIQSQYFTNTQRATWEVYRNVVVATRNKPGIHYVKKAKQALYELRLFLQSLYGQLT